ncbi:MAG: TrkH family potassium uptake protein [Parachlamydiales bacterium]|nr:TrkH family potassium uptake protein [Parachlamydiales bacterium]
MITRQKIHFKAIVGNIGLLIHVPAFMSLFSIGICIIFHETFAIFPFLMTAIISGLIGQSLYHRYFHPDICSLWDAMITAALGWFICSLIGAMPLYLTGLERVVHGMDTSASLAMSSFTNALFESFSGFTSTGLTMIQEPSKLPHVLQWWRSLMQWVGGIGLIVFIISVIEPNKEEYKLYYAEARTEKIGKSVKNTARNIWSIYVLYTSFSILLLFLVGMPLWDAINHALCGIATGGFTITDHNLQEYSSLIKIAIILVMILGTISFSVHFQIIRRGKISLLWRSPQHRWLLSLFFLGSIAVLFLRFFLKHEWAFIDSFFLWISALGTCGFASTNINTFSPMILLLFIAGMIIGGASGSTAGGIKMRRFRNLFLAISVRLKSITKEKEKKLLKGHEEEEEHTDLALPKTEKTTRLYAAGILFVLWIFSLTVGWFFLLFSASECTAFDALFDAASALGNVGLSTGFTEHNLPVSSKWTLIILMWIGRLEIVPFIILLLSFRLPFIHKDAKK